MKKFNRVLYAIISDMFESFLVDDPDMTNEELMQHMYQEFDETMQLVFDDLNSVIATSDLSSVNIGDQAYSRDVMVDMLVNGIHFESKDVKADSRSLIRHLNKVLDESFMIYPNIMDGEEGIIIVEKKNRIEANIAITGDKIFLLQGESESPDLNIFKTIYPELIKWMQGEDQQSGDDTPQMPNGKNTSNYSKSKFDYL